MEQKSFTEKNSCYSEKKEIKASTFNEGEGFVLCPKCGKMRLKSEMHGDICDYCEENQ